MTNIFSWLVPLSVMWLLGFFLQPALNHPALQERFRSLRDENKWFLAKPYRTIRQFPPYNQNVQSVPLQTETGHFLILQQHFSDTSYLGKVG